MLRGVLGGSQRPRPCGLSRRGSPTTSHDRGITPPRRIVKAVDLQTWCLWYKRRGAGRLRRMVMKYWDPIGVQGSPGARDEYDSYLGLIADRLRTRVTVKALADTLMAIEVDQMGMRPNRDHIVWVCRSIVAWYEVEIERFARLHPDSG
jgi:hypothetical protein